MLFAQMNLYVNDTNQKKLLSFKVFENGLTEEMTVELDAAQIVRAAYLNQNREQE